MYSFDESGNLLLNGNVVKCYHCGRVIEKEDLCTEESVGYFFDHDMELRRIEIGEEVFHMPLDYDGHSFCEHCGKAHLIRCEDCGEWYDEADTTCIETWEGRGLDVCNDCLDDHWRECDVCGRYVPDSEAEWDDDYTLCPDCYEDREGHKVIKEYDYSCDKAYDMDYLGIEDRKISPLMGVELEVEPRGYSYDAEDVASDVKATIGEDKVVICHDCSLNDGGFEIISCPANLRHHKENLKWEDGLRVLRDSDYRSHDGGHCGLHIHIDRGFFDMDRDELEMRYFVTFRNNLEWMKRFSRRTSFSYCEPNGYGDEINSVDKFVYPPDKVWIKNKKQQHRHCALNFYGDDTIEIRIFRGTLKYETFMATLEFAHIWARIVKSESIGQIMKVSLSTFKDVATMLHFNHFLNYVRERVEPVPEADESED